MGDPTAIADLVEGTLARFDRIDVLVNNAGIQHVSPLAEFPVAKWDAVLAINLNSAFQTIRLALPAMRRRGGGFKSAYVAASTASSG